MKLHYSAIGVIVAAIWGLNFVLVKVVCPHFLPFTFATLRFALASIPFVFILPKPKTSWKKIIGFATFMWIGQFIPMFMAIELGMPAGLCSLLTQAQVMVTTLLSIIVLKTRLSLISCVGLFISSLGVIWIAHQTQQTIPSISYFFVMISVMSISIGNLLIKTDANENILSFICWSTFCAFIAMLACALYFEGLTQFYTQIVTMPFNMGMALLYTSYGSTLVGFSLWGYLMRFHAPSMVAAFALLVPVFSIFFSATLFNEKFTLMNYLASALVLLGLVFHQMHKPLLLYFKKTLKEHFYL